jgi:hypothetical protein
MLGVAVLPVLCVRQHRPGDRHPEHMRVVPDQGSGKQLGKTECARDGGVMIQPPLKEAVRNGEPQMMPLFVCGVS